ncbi:DUF6328 family protein [Amycolatopsis thermoflava]|uniref:Integral membrane protein n=1 Tax=Amycolatopsis thermoflava TaxID=84480 RepID=A0A3N2GZ73_9PSEU|nr:DUF6328 family protein [Amycolatopsis thermoflava]ROS41419.1 hypothetical protein EDD35_3776 [Amycolatopsis thermoflava]
MSGRDEETPNQRLARNVNELLGELRVAQAGVQILFGFLLTVVFTSEFRAASGFEKAVHLSAVLLAVVSTALLSSPAAWHRILFRAGRRDDILRAGNRAVLAGLVCLAAAITATVSLIAKVVYGPIAMAVVGGLVGVTFAVLWFVVPNFLANHSASDTRPSRVPPSDSAAAE